MSFCDPEMRTPDCGRPACEPCGRWRHHDPEIVICAAVRFNGKVWRGNRHPHAIAAMHDELSYTMTRKEMYAAKTDTDQGFVTSRNRFVDREEGLALQLAAGIPSAAPCGYTDQLFSEDLY